MDAKLLGAYHNWLWSDVKWSMFAAIRFHMAIVRKFGRDEEKPSAEE